MANGGLWTPAVRGTGAFQRLPSFFVIGPPRTGSSWLHGILIEHAWLSHPTKETRFFDKHFHRGLGWYGSHYRGAAGDRRIGEIAPTYFASSEARERIARLIPQAKVVCTFRNPVDRVLSLYRLKRAYGLIPWTFEEAMQRDPELMESSRYAFHLEAWKSALGQTQVLPTIYEDLERDPQTYLDTVTDFVGVPRVRLRLSQVSRVLTSDLLTQPRNYYVTRAAAQLAEWSRIMRLDAAVARAKKWGMLSFFVGGGPAFSPLSSSQRLRLYKLFLPEVERLEATLNRDLSAWKRIRSTEGVSEAIGAEVLAPVRTPVAIINSLPPSGPGQAAAPFDGRTPVARVSAN